MSRWLRPKPRGDVSTQGTDGTKGDESPLAARLVSPTVPSVPSVEPSKATFSPRCAANGAPDLDAFAERAAIREFDGGEDRAAAERAAAAEQGYSDPADLYAAAASGWRRSLEALATRLSPDCAADARGREYIAAALRFVAEGWAEKAAALGWSELELFGADPHSPWERPNQMGAGYLDAAVEYVTASDIEYSGSPKFQRGQQAEGADLPWEKRRWMAPHSDLLPS